MTVENPTQEGRSRTEARKWLLAATVLTIIAAICVVFIGALYSWGDFRVLVALGTLPFIAESLIQIHD